MCSDITVSEILPRYNAKAPSNSVVCQTINDPQFEIAQYPFRSPDVTLYHYLLDSSKKLAKQEFRSISVSLNMKCGKRSMNS